VISKTSRIKKSKEDLDTRLGLVECEYFFTLLKFNKNFVKWFKSIILEFW